MTLRLSGLAVLFIKVTAQTEHGRVDNADVCLIQTGPERNRFDCTLFLGKNCAT